MFADECAEHLRAFVGVEVDDLDAVLLQPVDAAVEVDRFADDDLADLRISPLQYQHGARVVTIAVSR